MDTQPESIELVQSDQGELALRRLNDAAQRIAADESQKHPSLRIPRFSRLTPAYDISADIRRGCTPLPHSIYSTQPLTDTEDNTQFPSDLGPWSQNMSKEGDQDIWKITLIRYKPVVSQVIRKSSASKKMTYVRL